jgi:hypothetical protein
MDVRAPITAGLLALLTLLAVFVSDADPAVADCGPATIDFSPRQVHPGGSLVVVGSAWGDECHDAGRPPPGEGVLGRPVTDVELVVVQGSSEWLVGRASANAEYRFEVTVTVPLGAEPGPAELVARHGGHDAYNADPSFLITGSSPTTTASPDAGTTVATGAEAAPEPATSSMVAPAEPTDERSSAPWAWIIGVTALTVAVAAGGLRLIRRRRP